MPYANNKGADQPVHPGSLVSVFVGHCLGSIRPLVAISENPRLFPASVAGQAGLSVTLSQTSEDWFSHRMAQLCCNPLGIFQIGVL